MGQYANVTCNKMYQFLKWLGNHKSVDVTVGGRHPAKVLSRKNGEVYPLPIGHSKVVNKHIVKDFMEWLVRNEVCSQSEIDERM